jgi:hypothetical protein
MSRRTEEWVYVMYRVWALDQHRGQIEYWLQFAYVANLRIGSYIKIDS